jgi:hypothetical protein
MSLISPFTSRKTALVEVISRHRKLKKKKQTEKKMWKLTFFDKEY